MPLHRRHTRVKYLPSEFNAILRTYKYSCFWFDGSFYFIFCGRQLRGALDLREGWVGAAVNAKPQTSSTLRLTYMHAN